MAKELNKSFFDYFEQFRELGLLLFIVVLSVLVQIRNPSFLTGENINDMLKNTAILSILAIGMMLVLVTRGIDLSIASNMAFSGMLASLLVRDFPQIPTVIILLIGVGSGTFFGFLNGVFISKGRLLPIIATLGMMYILRGSTFLISKGKWVSSYQFTDSFKKMATGNVMGINNLILFALATYIVAFFFINHTATGRRIYATGSNPDSAKISGINTDRMIILSYSIMGMLSGFTGVLWMARFASAQSDSAMGYEMNVIAACVLGGVSMGGGAGKVGGVFLGALLFGILNNTLPLINISPFWQNALQGAIILLAVIANVIAKREITKRNLNRRLK